MSVNVSPIQRADEEAAKLYESFVESFEVEQRGGPQHGGGGHDPNGGFVRGGVVMPGQSPSARELWEETAVVLEDQCAIMSFFACFRLCPEKP